MTGMSLSIVCKSLVDDSAACFGVIAATGVRVIDSPPGLSALLDQAIAQAVRGDFPPPLAKDAIRALLRRGGFSPSGRNKPSSEYLGQAAREDRFPRINNLVDINNLVSLESGLPISLLDMAEFPNGMNLRYGQAGERYVFNAGGQEIDLAGLLSVCGGQDGQVPLGNAVKDSMRGKIKAESSGVLVTIYASAEAINLIALQELCRRFAQLLIDFGGAQSTDCGVLGAGENRLNLQS